MMTTEASSEPKRKYIKLNPATWAEIEALWQVGEVTLAELSDRYKVSQRTLQAHFHKHGIVKGEKSAAIAAAVKEVMFKEKLDDADLTVKRAKDVREAAYTNAVAVESLIMAQLQAVQKDPSQVLKAASAVKMLSLAAAGLERLHDLKWKALGLDRDSVFQDEIPELIIRDLTTKEIEELQAEQEEEDADSGFLSDSEGDAEPRDPEADEVVFETGETNTKPSVPKTAPRVDAEGCRLVREAQA
jgi:hypothetical protein